MDRGGHQAMDVARRAASTRSWTLRVMTGLPIDLGRPVALVGDADELVAEADRADDLGGRREERDDRASAGAAQPSAPGRHRPAGSTRGGGSGWFGRVDGGPGGGLVRVPGRVDQRCSSAHSGGSDSSGKIALTGHSGSHAPQSMHSFGSMKSLRSVPSS